MPGLEQGAREEQEDCLAQLEDDTQYIEDADLIHQHLTGNLFGLVTPKIIKNKNSFPKGDQRMPMGLACRI